MTWQMKIFFSNYHFLIAYLYSTPWVKQKFYFLIQEIKVIKFDYIFLEKNLIRQHQFFSYV